MTAATAVASSLNAKTKEPAYDKANKPINILEQYLHKNAHDMYYAAFIRTQRHLGLSINERLFATEPWKSRSHCTLDLEKYIAKRVPEMEDLISQEEHDFWTTYTKESMRDISKIFARIMGPGFKKQKEQGGRRWTLPKYSKE
ncbi:hypothetical protein BC940DRAFT_329774 [Gongronella butleri]|nr:hypothetical protein BC940DRAFT_329774 [Gongronella butleri]